MTMIFVNLPVKNLPASKAFFEKLGYRFNPQFTNDMGACCVIEEGSIHAMLLTHDFFQTFTPRAIADATTATEVLVCLSAESREAVDALCDKAIAAGGTEIRPKQDHGNMYGRNFADLDGHLWEIMWMDVSQMPKAPQ